MDVSDEVSPLFHFRVNIFMGNVTNSSETFEIEDSKLGTKDENLHIPNFLTLQP